MKEPPVAIEGLNIIGETINDSVPSTNKLFEANDIDGLLEIARMQEERGATYIDVNVGSRSPEFMADLVRRIQQVTTRPLSIDTPDPALARAGLDAYDADRAGGAKPVVNSISALRPEMFDLLSVQRFKPILLASEQVVEGRKQPCHTAEETVAAAKFLLHKFRDEFDGVNDDAIIDPGIAPIGTDSEGNFHRLMAAMKLMHDDSDFDGCHYSVGLSNFTVMLPSKRPDGMAVKSALESAFLTKAMPLGLDMVIGSVKRKYERLPEDHPAVKCLDEVLAADGFEVLMKVREFYA